MSIGLATSETRFVDFGLPIDSDAKGHASEVLPVAELDLTGALKGNGFFSDLSEPSIHAINQIALVGRRPEGTIMFFEGDTARGVYIV